MRRNMCFSAAIVIERLTDSTRTRINTAHVIVEIIAGRIFTLRPMEVLHGKFMRGTIKFIAVLQRIVGRKLCN